MIGWLTGNWPAIAGTVAAITLLAEAWRRCLGPGVIGAWHAVCEFVRVMRAAADLVQAQLNPNGGGSLIDKVDAQVTWQDIANDRFDGIDKQLQAGGKRFDAIELRLGVVPGQAENAVAEALKQ